MLIWLKNRLEDMNFFLTGGLVLSLIVFCSAFVSDKKAIAFIFGSVALIVIVLAITVIMVDILVGFSNRG